MRFSARRLTAAFCLLLGAVLLGVLLELLPAVLPDAVASRVARNSEGLALALVLVLWIQFARQRLSRHPQQWILTALASAVGVGIGVALLAGDLPSRFRTLNEAFLAAALLIPYLQLRRPLPARLARWLSGGALVVVVAFNRTGIVTDLAEMLGAVILAPVAFDLVDRGILDPSGRTSAGRRAAWYGALLVTPVVLSRLHYQTELPGIAGEAVRYGVRITETFVCLLLVELWFAVLLLLRRAGRAGGSTGAPAVGGVVATARAGRGA